MRATTTERQDLTLYSQSVLYGLVLPLLFIAGVQLFILSTQTETYFAWTFAAPIAAAFLGAGYWAAMFHAYIGARGRSWAAVRAVSSSEVQCRIRVFRAGVTTSTSASPS